MSKLLLGPDPHCSRSIMALGEWLSSAWSDQASFPLGSGVFQRNLRERGSPLSCRLGRRDPNTGLSETGLTLTRDRCSVEGHFLPLSAAALWGC